MSDPARPAPPAPSARRPDPGEAMALNRMGAFEWDLSTGQIAMDDNALAVFEMTPEEYGGDPRSLNARVPAAEVYRLDTLISQALNDGSSHYGAYFRTRRPDGTLRWTHTQGAIQRDGAGRALRIVGVLRDATLELTYSAVRLALDRERARQTSIVESTTAALAHARTVGEVVDVLDGPEGLKRLGAGNVILGLVESGHISLVAEGQAGSYAAGTEFTRVSDPFPMSEVVRTMRPLFVLSRREFRRRYPRLWPYIEPRDIDSAAYLPLIAQGRVIGAIALFYKGKSVFTPEERNLLIALGSSIAQSLQRAMLFDQEHHLAEDLQRAMLPRTIPELAGAQVAVRYRPAGSGRDIGGDWYDVIPLPGGRVAVVIGDVQGHDTEAAAVMGQLRIVLRAYATEGHSPVTVMARASEFLHELDTDRFATCVYAEVDLDSGALRVVRAGHVDPLVRAADGTARWLSVPGGLPLGLSAEFGQLEYPVTRLGLDPGETVLLCTDGLLERPGSGLEEGMRELAERVASGPAELGALADSLLDLVETRGGDDDMALLALRRGGSPAVGDTGGRLTQHVNPADPEGLSAARHMIRAAVRAWGAGDRSDEVELVADELVTNALLHTDGPAVVTARTLRAAGAGPAGVRRHRVRIEVADASSAMPRRREPGESGVSGRGLLLVDRLADVWGVEPRGDGKVVWCEFALG
ncbi:SpoIIE family protein phosphatase [Streptomyces polyrhachis]|uniref:SpoIIE family protein phosphatase n=1 Tax=Streptomyces polyrhachis TaxID=1282885 RepID=A0ABW2GIY5_9ACTN